MSFTQQYEDDLAMGCVCDFDVYCKSHPDRMGCGACENACHCDIHGKPDPRFCKPEWCPQAPTKPQTHASYRKEWIAEWRAETGDTAKSAALSFEQMLNQAWDGCTCAQHQGASY